MLYCVPIVVLLRDLRMRARGVTHGMKAPRNIRCWTEVVAVLHLKALV